MDRLENIKRMKKLAEECRAITEARALEPKPKKAEEKPKKQQKEEVVVVKDSEEK